MSLRYARNKQTISEDEQVILSQVKIAVIGCGGLGGYIAEQLCRLGIGELTLVDYDVFEESNLNRQILANTGNLGQFKVEEAGKRLHLINPSTKLNLIRDKFSSENASLILAECDLVMDALDSITARLALQKACSALQIPFIHGAIAGWYAQITTVFPGDDTLNTLYSNQDSKGIEKELGNPAFTPAVAASWQVAEAVKVLLKKGEILRKKILFINLLDNEMDTVEL